MVREKWKRVLERYSSLQQVMVRIKIEVKVWKQAPSIQGAYLDRLLRDCQEWVEIDSFFFHRNSINKSQGHQAYTPSLTSFRKEELLA